MTTFILKMSDGKLRKIEVPEDWSLTYGQLVPGMTKNEKFQTGNYGAAGYGLRFYEGSKTNGKTKMVIGGVIEFWPEDISIQEQIVETKRQHYGENAPEGFKNSTVEAKIVSWREVWDKEEKDNRFLEDLTLP